MPPFFKHAQWNPSILVEKHFKFINNYGHGKCIIRASC